MPSATTGWRKYDVKAAKDNTYQKQSSSIQCAQEKLDLFAQHHMLHWRDVYMGVQHKCAP
jgi:hypothetical protein